MLTPDQIERLGNSVQVIIDPITDWLVREIARRISEAGQLTSTAAYEVWKLQTLGKSQKEIKKKLQQLLGVSQKEIEELLKQSAEVGYRYDLEFLPTSAAIPFAENPAVQSIVSAAVAEAGEQLQNFYGTTSIGFITENMAGEKSYHTIDDALYKACDDAFMRVSTGAQDYNSAIRDATRQLANRGIVALEYKSGRKIELGAHVRLNVIGGLGLMQEKISQQVHDDFEADGWEISAHFASAPDHEPIQGKQYPDAEYQALNDSLVRRIGTLNCGHSAHPIIMGVSQPQYSAAQLAEMRQSNQNGIDYEGRHYTTYQATQKQREIERAIREQKRRTAVAEATGDKERIAQYNSRLRVLNAEYRRFSKAAGLVEQRERTWIAGSRGERSYLYRETVDFMGQPKIFTYQDFNKKEIVTKGYSVDGHEGIFTQTNTKDAQNTITLIEREKENIPQLKNVNEIIINKDLPGVAAYDHSINRLYVNEKISNDEYIHNELESNYFVAENAEDVLRHEMHHKDHWDLIDRKALTSGKDSGTIKREIEADLRAYVMNQISSQSNYISAIVSKNAAVGLKHYNSLNELIAEVLLQNDKGNINDPFLMEKVGEMFHDASNVR